MTKIKGLSIQKLILFSTALLAVILFLIIKGITDNSILNVPDQRMGQRWSPNGGSAEISVFFMNGSVKTPDDLGYVEYEIIQALNQESIDLTSKNTGARLLASCFSANGRISMVSEYGKADLSALGVGGDFFLFHEPEFISGSAILPDDLNSDYCILDESAAWKLFGSSDVAGQTVYVGEIPLIVKGVVKLPQGKVYKAAGIKQDFCYINYDFLSKYGACDQVSTYEIVMPNPVPGFAYDKVKKYIGVDDSAMVIVDNTARFGIINRLKNIQELKYRSMSNAPIAFPFWENMARYVFDNSSIMTVIYLLLAIYAGMMVLVLIIVLIVQNKDSIVRMIVDDFDNIRSILVRKIRGGS